MNSVKFKPCSRERERERERERDRDRVQIEFLIPFDIYFCTAVTLDINYKCGVEEASI